MFKDIIKRALIKLLCALCWWVHKDRPQDCWLELALNVGDEPPLCDDCKHNPLIK